MLKTELGKEWKKHAVQLRMLNQVSTKLQSQVSSDDFYQDVLNIVHSYFQYYAIQFWKVESSSLRAQLVAQSGAYVTHLKLGDYLNFSETGGITKKVILTKESYLSNDVSVDPNFTNLSLPVTTKAELCVPIIKNGEVVATINVEEDRKDAFDEDDITTLEAIAGQVSVALTNKILFSEAQGFTEKLKNAVDEKTLELRKAHQKILEQQKLLKKENKALKTLVEKDQSKANIVGESQAIQSMMTMVEKIAPTPATVLIQGESGTGKELVACQLHLKSDRVHRPFVTVNCGALQESLLESELFGHEKGSFTGAIAQKSGLAETADGGTLFLDEIGEMSLGIQTKLLRFLQEGEFYRVGGKKSIKVNVRVVSATNKDLEAEVKKGKFREDLFYRLNTITLRTPPLRKRLEDIPMLVNHFLAGAKRISPQVIEAFQNYDWPGNIRELQNTVERLKILSDTNDIGLEDVPYSIRKPESRPETTDYTVDMPLEQVEKNHILRTLQYHQGNKTRTANSLGITIKTLYNKLHKYGIQKDALSREASA